MIKKLTILIEILKSINFKDNINSITPCDVLFFCHDVDRGITLNNQAYSPLIDSIKDDLESKGYKCLSIAHPWSKITGIAGYGEPININSYFLFAKIIKKIFGRFGFTPELKLYEIIIMKAKPKIIITIGLSNALCEVARRTGVFHVELLHGIGYTPIPWDWDRKEKRNLPQGILSLDPVSTKTFSELKKHDVLIKEVAHPFLRRFDEINISNIPPEWLPNKTKERYDKEILVSLQWGYTDGIDEIDAFKGILPNGLFYKEIEKVIKLTCKTVYWRFRMHPVQYRQPKKYKKIFDFIKSFVESNENCDWEESTYIPLPGLLMQCSGHITMLSMVSYEAAYLGVPTLALCPTLRNDGAYKTMFNDLVEQNYLLKQPSQVDTILEWVNNTEKIAPLLKSLNDSEVTIDTVDWLFLQAKKVNKETFK